MRVAGDAAHGRRLWGLVVILWRAGLRIQEALALAEADLDHARGALPVRHGKGERRREVGMDAWSWDELQPWLELRLDLPVGPLFRVINGSSRGRHWASAAARAELRRKAVQAGVRRRFAPHQLPHAHAVEIRDSGIMSGALRPVGHRARVPAASLLRASVERHHRALGGICRGSAHSPSDAYGASTQASGVLRRELRIRAAIAGGVC